MCLTFLFYIPEDDRMVGRNIRIRIHRVQELILLYLSAFVGTTIAHILLIWLPCLKRLHNEEFQDKFRSKNIIMNK
jgi:hypothetical protein